MRDSRFVLQRRRHAGQCRLGTLLASKARRFTREFTRKSGEESGYTCSEDFYCSWRGWSCRNDGRSGDIKHRCETVNTDNQRVMVVKWGDRIE